MNIRYSSVPTVAIFEGDHEIDDMPDVKTELFEDLEVLKIKFYLITAISRFRFNQSPLQAVVVNKRVVTQVDINQRLLLQLNFITKQLCQAPNQLSCPRPLNHSQMEVSSFHNDLAMTNYSDKSRQRNVLSLQEKVNEFAVATQSQCNGSWH